jgi:hypothetical protein
MDHAAQPEDAAASAGEERRIDETADVLAVTLLGMWRAKHRPERGGSPSLP